MAPDNKRQALSIFQMLRDLKGPSRKADAEIALFLGFEKKEYDRVVWLHPETRSEAKVPRYTEMIDHAYDFAQLLQPDHVGACTWQEGSARAQIEPGPPIDAHSPAIAICMCAIYNFIKKGDRSVTQVSMLEDQNP